MLTFIIVLIVLTILVYIFPMGVIEGNSMSPNFKHGDIVLVCRIFKLKPNQCYYFERDLKENCTIGVIKRLHYVEPMQDSKSSYLWFLGDNPEESFDSRHYGYVGSSRVKAKIITIVRRSKNEKNN